MQLSISDFLKIIVPIIGFLFFSIPFLLLFLGLLSVLKSFLQKRGRILGGIIFNGIEEYAVVVINDKINSIGNAVSALKMIGISEKMAFDFALRIHEEGIAIVWTGTRDEAVQYVQIIRQNGLRCFMTAIQE
jgi:ATP-dependent Clp protease adapter protein ClpS